MLLCQVLGYSSEQVRKGGLWPYGISLLWVGEQ